MLRYPEYKDSGIEWIGEIPKHWKVHRLAKSVDKCINGIWGNERDGMQDMACVRVADFNRQKLRVNSTIPTIRSIPLSKREGRVLVQGDLLLEKSGGGERQPVGVVVIYDHIRPAVCSNFIARINVVSQCDSTFMKYLHAYLYSIRINTRSIKQTTGIQNLDSNSYLDERVSFPPLGEQVLISEFLDRKAEQIDSLVEKLEKKIELLKEYRASLISQCVTKGLDPDVEMRDSGIEWIEEIPKHWAVRRIKFVAQFQLSSIDRHIVEGEEDVHVCHYPNVYYNEKISSTAELPSGTCTKEEYEQYLVKEGDLLLTKDSESPSDIGVPCLIAKDLENTVYGYHLGRFQFHSEIHPNFGFRFIQSEHARIYFENNSKGITRYAIGKYAVENLVLPVPTKIEQSEISQHLDKKTSQIDFLIDKLEQKIELLQEYRQSLISNVVTGKIMVAETVQ